MRTDLEPIDHFDQMNKVVEAMLKGTKPRQIAKQLDLRLMDVEKYISEWQELARNNRHIQDRAREALTATDQHYDMIISGLWNIVDEADINGDYKAKKDTYKTIADIEKQRIEMLQKSGLLDNQQMAEQVLEMERKQEVLVGILRKIKDEYPEIAGYLRKELSKVTGQAESTVVAIEPY